MRWSSVAAPGLLFTAVFAPAAVTGTELAVTVDDLPATGVLPSRSSRLAIAAQMIQTLKRHAVPDVYGFANGGQLRSSPELEGVVLAWRRAGFLLGNHTLSHLDFTRVSVAEYVADIERNEEVLAPLSSPGTPKFFRYPYLHEGNTPNKRKAAREWLATNGYTIAHVTVSFEEWGWNDVYARCVALADAPAIARLKSLYLDTATATLATLEELSLRLFERPIKHILLVHVHAFDALMLDDLLAAYRAAGSRFIGLHEALRDPAYAIDAGLGDDGATFLVRVARTRQVPVPGSLSRAPRELATLCR